MRKSAHHQHFLTSFLSVVVMILTILGQYCNGQKDAGYKCPLPSSISPCTCSQYADLNGKLIDNSIVVDCNSKNLNDEQMSAVLNAFFFAPKVSPVIEIRAGVNRLTRIPQQISEFPYLSTLYLGLNKITEIPYVIDKRKPILYKNRFTNGSIIIDLQYNEIENVPSGSFNFLYASSVSISLDYNKIASIASDAFRFPSAAKIALTLTNNQIVGVIPDGVFNYPNASKLCFIYLSKNQISAISPNTFNCPLATHITIGLGANSIPSIPFGVFNFPSAKFVSIYLSENKIKDIPCGAFNYPLVTIQANIGLDSNQITTIPSCAFNFPSSHWVEITLINNSISVISPGAFNFPSALARVKLQNNRISAIPPNTFEQGKFQLLLQNNQLKRFESAVFKTPVMNEFPGDHISAAIDGNPIDCWTDPCHLAWLLKSSNKNQLLSRISGSSVCSSNGGTPFSDLVNSNFDFSKNCPCSYNY